MPKATEELQMIKDYLVATLIRRFKGAHRVDQMQQEFAREAGISTSFLSGILNHGKPIADSWAGIADALGLSMEKTLEAARKWRKENPPVSTDAVRERVKSAVDFMLRNGQTVSPEARDEMQRYLQRIETSGAKMELYEIVQHLSIMSKHTSDEFRSRLKDGEEIEAATRRPGGRRSVTLRSKGTTK